MKNSIPINTPVNNWTKAPLKHKVTLKTRAYINNDNINVTDKSFICIRKPTLISFPV